MICSACSVEKVLAGGKDRLPKGWKRLGEEILCAKCVKDRFALRAVTIPVVGPLCTETPGAKDSEELDWPEFRDSLKASWIATTEASNWMIRELAKVDPGRGEDGKLLPMPKTYFYPEIRRLWPVLATCSVTSLEQAVVAKYRAARWDIAMSKVSLPSFRYPVPIPVHNATWSVWEEDGGALLVSFRLGEQRITLKLRGGHEFRRQRMMVRQIIDGTAMQGELAIYRVNATFGDHRNGDTKGTRVMCKMVARLPRDRRAAIESIASCHTGGDAFLALFDANQNRIFRWNADHVARRIMARDEEMQRLREDLKAEKRLGRERDGILARMDLVSQNQRAYLHSFCHEVTAQVVALLQRRRVTHLIYVHDEQGATKYVPHFPWFKFTELLGQKCHKANIEIASGSEVAETP